MSLAGRYNLLMPSPRAAGRWILALAVLALALGAWYFTASPASAPALAVVAAPPDDPAASPLASAVSAELTRRGRYRLVPPSAAPFLLRISVRASANSSVTASLLEPATGRERWREDFYAPDAAALDSLAATIAGDLETALGAGQ